MVLASVLRSVLVRAQSRRIERKKVGFVCFVGEFLSLFCCHRSKVLTHDDDGADDDDDEDDDAD